MASTLILGSTDTGGNSYATSNYLWLFPVTALASLNLNRIRVYAISSGSVKVGLYQDNSGDPEGQPLLTSNNTGTLVISSQWNQLVVPSYSLVSSNYYWLALIASANCIRLTSVGGSTSCLYSDSQSYASGLPEYCPLDTAEGSYDLRINGWNVDSSGSLLFGGGL